MRPAAAVERLPQAGDVARVLADEERRELIVDHQRQRLVLRHAADLRLGFAPAGDRKSTRLNSSHSQISYAVFCLKKKSDLAGAGHAWRTHRHTVARTSY